MNRDSLDEKYSVPIMKVASRSWCDGSPFADGSRQRGLLKNFNGITGVYPNCGICWAMKHE